MYKVVKLMETKNGKFRKVVIRRFRSLYMAQFVAKCLFHQYYDNDDVVVGYQHC